ncbi:TetR/AcrR family transcriptional regulator C-terminal domain-containing protein [Lysinibacillus sp. LZ02]|uniref:TetR/AcrR family transcriptional regulator C-terminal domain-containing protein n=1 Tax=Lysinibacillus sp. LZ02 TaxID=3420668 RepID=UPI003D36A3E7
MQTKPLEKISIQEVTDNADLNRQTFYYHFEDIYDLLKWTLEREALELLYERKDEQLWNEGLRELLHYLDQNRAFAVNAVQSLGRDHFNRFFYQEVNDLIMNVIQQFTEEMNVCDDKYLGFLAHYYTLSFTAIAISWLMGEMDYTVDEFIQMIDQALREQLTGAKVLSSEGNCQGENQRCL